MKGLYEYYRGQQQLPTFADFQGGAEVERYAQQRAAVLTTRAKLPVALFNGARLLEFGPDSGENALVFARWGAHVTLVEPNERAHATIRAYFDRFGQGAALGAISSDDVLAYRDTERYDIVVAEGFIYTVQPTCGWLDAFHRLLRPDGLFLVTYYERHGGLFELATRALHRMHRRSTGLDAVTAAERLFSAKWAAIPHTRRFESWVMDVLENPFVRATTFIDAATFVADVATAGFELYATHPQYDDGLNMDWHKYIPGAEERIARATSHIERSTLSFAAGRKLYIGDRDRAARVKRDMDRLIADIDALIDGDDAAAAVSAASGFDALASAAREPGIVADGRAAIEAGAAAFAAFARAFRLAANADATGLAHHTAHDAAFIANWGLPAHVAVARATQQ